MTIDDDQHPPGWRVVLQEFGDSPLDAIEHNLRVERQPFPDVAGLGPRDVVVAVRSAAVGWVDLLMTSGQYQHLPSPPFCPGMEYSGVTVWTGEQVDPTAVSVGDHVLADGFLTGPRSQGDHQQYGGFASYAVAPLEALLRLPEKLSFDQGCNLLGNYETAYHALVACGALQAGEVVLILGASGSTGLAAVHLAKLLGATVIGAGRSSEKLKAVQAQGADHVVSTGGGEERRLRDEVKALTSGRGVDVVYDPVGGDISVESMRCAKFGARFLVVGWAATPFVAQSKGKRGAPQPNTLPTNLIMMKGLHVLGCPTVIATHRDPTIRTARLRQIMQWVHDGKLAPHVARTFPMADIKEAMRAKWASEFVGGCVVHP